MDLRFNGGGNSSIVEQLVEGLKSRPTLTAKGHLYTLISSQTFSSAMFAAMDFRDGIHAILVGEPPGNKPNHYGEQRNFSLPNSKLMVNYSTKHFHLIKDADPSTLKPDIAVRRSLGDFLAGRDPVLEAALHHPLQ
jgi:C-terminal processing protease CtpA/Prc